MGLDRALEMTLLGEAYDGATAERLGLVTEAVAAEELQARTLALAEALAQRAPLAVRLAKSLMRRGLDSTLEQSQGDAALSVMITNPSADVREGVAAFRQTRAPRFEGLAFRDSAAREEYADGASDLTLKRTLEIMSDDLDSRGLGKLDIDAGYEDPDNRRLIHDVYSTPQLNDASRRKIP